MFVSCPSWLWNSSRGLKSQIIANCKHVRPPICVYPSTGNNSWTAFTYLEIIACAIAVRPCESFILASSRRARIDSTFPFEAATMRAVSPVRIVYLYFLDECSAKY